MASDITHLIFSASFYLDELNPVTACDPDQSYFRNENENEKYAANHTAILCQPAVAQQCEHNLASSSWAENSCVIWWFRSWISTSLKSSTRLLIWLRQMPPHSGNRSRLFTAGWLLLWRILHVHQHYRLMWSVFFLCVRGILCSGRRNSTQQSLEMRACLKLNQKVCVW